MANRLTRGSERPRRPLSTGCPRAIQRGSSLLTVPAECGRYVGRIGALAVALGVGAAVLAMPLAAADATGSAGSARAAEGSRDSSSRTTGVDSGERRAGVRGAATADRTGRLHGQADRSNGAQRRTLTESPVLTDAGARSSLGPQAAGMAAADSGGAKSAAMSSGQPDTADRAAPSAAQPQTTQRGAAARAARSAESAPRAAAAETGSAREAAAENSPALLTTEATVRTPAATSAARPGAALIEQSLTGLGLAVERLLDAVDTWLSSLPAGPATDFLAGGLLLVRRGLFNQTPTVAPRVLVGEVLRPMRPEEGSTFATSLIGEVVGTLGAVDPEGAVLSYALSRSPQFGAVRVDPDGIWSYTPSDASAALEDAFTVSINDGGWNILDPFASPAQMTIRVQPGLSSSSNKPGLISSDWLEVVKRTGDFLGDEPVMMTVIMTTTLGVSGSTSVRMVDKYPNEIGSSLTAGSKVPIPDKTGDAWIDYSDKFKPLEIGDLLGPLKIPVVVGLTMMFEGDLSRSGLYLDLFETFLESDLSKIGKELENTEIKISGDDYQEAVKDAMADAQKRIGNAVNLGKSKIVAGALYRIAQWVTSYGNPDDPVGLGLTALIPVGDSFTTPTDPEGPWEGKIPLEVFALKGRQVCIDAAPCYVDRVEVTAGGYDYTEPPAVRITSVDGKGSGATARPLMEPHPVEPELEDIVARVEVTNRGSGYASPPKVEFDSNSGSGAEAVALLGGGLMLNDQYLGLVTIEERNPVFDTNIPIRYGFMLPGGSFGRQAQGWETTYAGDYLDNDWAEWKVETQAWTRVSW